MSSGKDENKSSPEGDRAHPKGTRRIRHFRGYWNIDNTKDWVEMFKKHMSAVKIGKAVGADPSTVTTWLKRHGAIVYAGQHYIGENLGIKFFQLSRFLPKERLTLVLDHDR